jgi:dTDP-4-dehydrorhamnose reductase
VGSRETFEAFENLINCPTYMGDLCGAVARLLEHRQNGIFHCVGPEAMSRYDYAFRVAEAFHLPTSQVVKGTLDLEADCRPASLRLDGRSTWKNLDLRAMGLMEVLNNKNLSTEGA